MQGKFFSGLLASVAFSTLLTTGYASAQSSPPVTAEQVEGIVRSYLCLLYTSDAADE